MIPKYRVWIEKDKKHYPIWHISCDRKLASILIGYANDSDAEIFNLQWIRYYGDNINDCILESSTGETDRNGREIFEGNRVKYIEHIEEILYDVKFLNGVFYPLNCDRSKEFEIIGNIHKKNENK